MTLDELRKLPPEQAMQAAASELSLPATFFDRMWAQESDRGQKLRSPKGAEGHFQQMPQTRQALETRFKTSFNPDDFYDGLFMASEVMRENLGKFKDPVDATRAYNAGWKTSRWNNPETIGYVNALWGDAAPDGAVPHGDNWPALPVPPSKRKDAPNGDAATAAVLDVSTQAARVQALDTPDTSRRSFERGQQDAAKEQAKRDATGFGDVMHEALRDPRVMPTWTIMRRFDEGVDVDPTFDYLANRDKYEEGLSDEERSYVRDHATSESSVQSALAELNYRRDIDQTYGAAGGVETFAGQMLSGLADPASLVTGLAVAKGFQAMRIGHAAIAASGRGALAVGALAAENATANLAIEGLADAMGDTKTSADYAMAATAGAAFTLPFARGVFRQAAEAEAHNLARGLHERAVSEQVDQVAQVMRDEPHLQPEEVARKVDQNETARITQTLDEATGPQRQEPVIPRDVMQEMGDEFAGVVPEQKPKQSDERLDPATDNYNMDEATRKHEEFLREKATQDANNVLKQIQDKGTVEREVTDPATGDVIRLSWNAREPKFKGQGNIAQALDAIQAHSQISPVEKRLAKYLAQTMSKDGLDVDIRFVGRDARGNFDPKTSQVTVNDAGGKGMSSLEERVASLSKYGIYTVLHESVHAATYHRLNAWEKHAAKLTSAQRKTLAQFEDLFDRYKDFVAENRDSLNKNRETGAQYAAKNLHEFAAQMFTDRETRLVLSQMEGRTVAGKVTSALQEFMSLVRRVLGLDKSTAFDEGSKLLDQIIAMPIDNVRFANGAPVFAAPQITTGSSGKPNPLIARRARDTWAPRIYAYAENYLRQNPIDRERLKTLTMKIGGASDGLILANSKNPIMQLVASLVTETTTGAAGRKANVAIRSHLLTRKFVGNSMIDYDNAYTIWRHRNGGSVAEDMFKGDKRRMFDQSVYTEVLNRRRKDYTPNKDRAVSEAADALEGLFERSRVAQIDSGVLGHGNLPETSRGYIPQALDGVKLQAATLKDLNLLHEALSRQFMDRLGWDEKFARDFAPFYTERARRRSMGDKGIESLGAGGEGLQLIRDTLEEMQGDPSLVDRARAAQSKLGQTHTKSRLNLDLLQELRPGLRMMDFFNTNPLLLARSYAKRTAGTVALTDAGIHGIRGVRELEQAALHKMDGTQPTAQELEAFRRVVAEILGTPVAGAVVSQGASNMQLLVGLQRLGGLVFTQAAETYNMIHHLGLRSLLSGIADLPKMMGEIGRLKRGAPSGNHILTSIEQYGGEIGTESFKMVAPLDAPEGRLAEYVDQPGLMTRLLRAGGHLQSKISGFRGLMAAQHRMVAEQIVMKAARFIREGGEDVALRDMGFTPEVTSAMKRELQTIAKWDERDKLLEFDLTRVSDPRVAEAFVQAVHRGTSQIIQGTFVGERTKWFHNDYMRLLLQLRSFGLTATEKQWGRTRMNHGYAYAAGVLLGQMALTLPIHFARIQIAAAGRHDRDQYIKDNLHPAALTRALMNYASISGMAADTLDVMTGIAGGWGGSQARELLGARNGMQATSVGRIVPIAGTLDTAARVAAGRTDKYTALKQLPFSNLWWLLPAINVTKD